MKTLIYLSSFLLILACCFSCDLLEDDEDDDNTNIDGEQSPMGDVGTTFSSSTLTIAGVSDVEGSISNLNNGVSTLKAKAVVTNPALKNLLSNFPEVSVNGDTVSTDNAKFRITKDGIEYLTGPTSGVLVNYGSSVGDKYPIGSTGSSRTVVSKSSDDDYEYGFLLIKVLEIEEPATAYRSAGINEITYWANHRFGLVGFEFSFDDGTSAKFPLYCSAEN
jgi:hypothetical protein